MDEWEQLKGDVASLKEARPILAENLRNARDMVSTHAAHVFVMSRILEAVLRDNPVDLEPIKAELSRQPREIASVALSILGTYPGRPKSL